MRTCPTLALVLWLYYEAWRDNGFKNVDADGAVFRPQVSVSRMRRVKEGDYGARMSLLNNLNKESP